MITEKYGLTFEERYVSSWELEISGLPKGFEGHIHDSRWDNRIKYNWNLTFRSKGSHVYFAMSGDAETPDRALRAFLDAYKRLKKAVTAYKA